MSNRLPILAGEIGAAEAQIRRNANLMAAHVIQAGHHLIEAKALIEHGGWRTWLTEHVGMPERTASAYMRIASSGLKSATVADLGIRGSIAVLSRTKLQLPPPGYLAVLEAGNVLLGKQWKERSGVIKPSGNGYYDIRATWFPDTPELPTEETVIIWQVSATEKPLKDKTAVRDSLNTVMGGPIWETEIVKDNWFEGAVGRTTWELGGAALRRSNSVIDIENIFQYTATIPREEYIKLTKEVVDTVFECSTTN